MNNFAEEVLKFTGISAKILKIYQFDAFLTTGIWYINLNLVYLPPFKKD
jgi:hypothetical protein